MRRLDPSEAEITARELVASLQLRAAGERDRPRVAAAMIAAVDGRATIDGTSTKLGHPEDRALLRELRTGVDCVLAGTRTLIAEKYANLLDDDQRAHRAQQGFAEHPIVATVDRRGTLKPGDVPIFAEADVPVVVYTEQDGFTLRGAEVEQLDEVDFPRVLAHLAEHHGVRAVSCEGGPSLLRELVAQGCLDELLITVAPMLVAGDGPTPIVGDAFDAPAQLSLDAVHRAGDHIFLHYRA